jgi:hypothetical protein
MYVPHCGLDASHSRVRSYRGTVHNPAKDAAGIQTDETKGEGTTGGGTAMCGRAHAQDHDPGARIEKGTSDGGWTSCDVYAGSYEGSPGTATCYVHA